MVTAPTELVVMISGGFRSSLEALVAMIELQLNIALRIVAGPSMGDKAMRYRRG